MWKSFVGRLLTCNVIGLSDIVLRPFRDGQLLLVKNDILLPQVYSAPALRMTQLQFHQ